MTQEILFVCTGNIFRSLTAELALKKVLGPDSPIKVSSAGTVAQLQSVDPILHEELLKFGLDPSAHRQRKLTEDLLKKVDLPVAMSTDHLTFMKDVFDFEPLLFKQILCGERAPLLDVHEAILDHKTNLSGRENYIRKMVQYLVEVMPQFAENLGRILEVRLSPPESRPELSPRKLVTLQEISSSRPVYFQR